MIICTKDINLKTLCLTELDVITLNTYIFRWTSKSVYSQAKESSHANDESYLSPVITVEGRGKGFAVVQMKNTFYIKLGMRFSRYVLQL